MRKFLLNLKGPTSIYCNCSKPCSRFEIDHVMPISYLRKQTEDKKALYDPHNLYRCCGFMNTKKGAFILDVKSIGQEISGLMARSYLYMHWKHGIILPHGSISYLLSMSLLHKPFDFEKERGEKIHTFYGLENPFVSRYPQVLHDSPVYLDPYDEDYVGYKQ